MTWIYRLVLVVSLAIVYAPVARYSFVEYDDPLFVTKNASVQKGFNPDSVLWALSTFDCANWIPVTWLTHLADWEWWKDWAGGHHLQSLGWHLVGTVLLFEALRLATKNAGASFLVAAIYALHPLHVESVAWISERKGIVSSAFAMLTILLYVIYTRQPGADRMSLVVVSHCLGLMAKPMLVPLPMVLLLLDRWPLDRLAPGSKRPTSELAGPGKISLSAAIFEKWPLLATSLIFVPIAYWSQQAGKAISTAEGLPMEYRLRNADYSLVTYLRRYFWPSDLVVFYPHPKDSIGLPMLAIYLTILLTITLLVIRWSKARPWLAVGWLWYVVMIFPLSGLIPIGAHGMADRYSDLPLIGISIALVWTGVEWTRRWKIPTNAVRVGCVLLLMALAAGSALQVRHWKNHETLFTHVLAIDPDNFMGHNELGVLAWKAGDLPTAERHFQLAIAADASFALGHRNLGMVQLQQGRTAEAIKQFGEAGDWGDGPSLMESARILMGQGETARALEACEKGMALGEETSGAWTLRGLLLIKSNRFPEAETSLVRAINLDPTNARARQHLGAVYLAQQKLDQARLQFAWGASLDPQVADDVEKLVEASREEDPVLLDMSAACQSQVERFGVACRRIESALKVAFKQGRNELIPGMQARLRAYLNDQTYMQFSLTQLPNR
jgi:tetratricopeptide (TPR) repeat protein